MRTPVEFKGRDGLRLTADVAGDAASPPVVFFHGGGQTRHAWGTTLDVLADQGWRAYSVDLRGHGNSDWNNRHIAPALTGYIAARTGSFAQALGLTGVVLVGGVVSYLLLISQRIEASRDASGARM